MSARSFLLSLISSVLLLAACAPQTSQSIDTSVPVTDTASLREPVASPTLELTTETSVPATPGPGYYPLSTRTGNADMDVVIAAVESGDPKQLQALIRFTTVPCTKAEGLGGPPKCEADESEGTPLKVLPFLGPEGHFMREADLAGFPGVSVIGIYAGYQVSDSAYSEESYPAGEYAIMFKGSDNQTHVVIHIRGGIVRIDYLYPPTSIDGIIQRDASELILAPMK